jgi:hypothetical protein
MTPRRRVGLKVLWMAILITAIVLMAQVRHAFVYQAF